MLWLLFQNQRAVADGLCHRFWLWDVSYFQGFTDDQLLLVEQNTVMVEEREREIRQIVQSISDLNEIFRDLASMVVEQVCG